MEKLQQRGVSLVPKTAGTQRNHQAEPTIAKANASLPAKTERHTIILIVSYRTIFRAAPRARFDELIGECGPGRFPRR
jgi:hypothetical protein